MSNPKPSFSIFRRYEDHYKWHKLIEYVNASDEFDVTEKAAIENALREISSWLGSSFLADGARFNHFISQHFMNKAPWALRWSIWFADALRFLVRNDGSGKMLSRLKSKLYHEEALTFLELNYYLSQAGLSIKFEQEVIVNSVPKFPDFKLENPRSGEVIFMELTSLHISDEHDWNKSIFHRMSEWISKDILQRQINYCGKLSKLSEDNYDKIALQIWLMKKQIIDYGGFYFIEDENLTFAMASWRHSDGLSAWAASHQMAANSLSGDEIKLDSDIGRLKNKIKDKASQLSNEYFNVIGISMHQLFMTAGDKILMFREIANYLTRFPHILGVLIYGQDALSNKDDRYTEVEGHLFATKTIAQLHTTCFFFVRNPTGNSCNDKSTEEMFYQAFRFGKRLPNPE